MGERHSHLKQEGRKKTENEDPVPGNSLGESAPIPQTQVNMIGLTLLVRNPTENPTEH